MLQTYLRKPINNTEQIFHETKQMHKHDIRKFHAVG